MKKYLTSLGIAGLVAAIGAAGFTQTGCDVQMNVPSRVSQERGASRRYVESGDITQNIEPSTLLSDRDVAKEDRKMDIKPDDYFTMISDIDRYDASVESSDKHSVVVFYDSRDVKGQTERTTSSQQALKAAENLHSLFGDYINFFAVDVSEVDASREYRGSVPGIVLYKNHDFDQKPEKNLVFGRGKGSKAAEVASLFLPVSNKRVWEEKYWDDEPDRTPPEKHGVEKAGKWTYFNSDGTDYKGIEQSIVGWTEKELFN